MQYLHMFVFLFIPTGSPSSWPCSISGLHREVCLHQAGDQAPVSLLNSLCSASPCLPEWWEEEVACNDSSPLHMPTGLLWKGLSHTIFSLSEEESPYTSMAYLPSEVVQLRLLFWGVCGSYQNCCHTRHQDSALCRGGVCCCISKGNGKGRQCSDLLFLTCCSVAPKQPASCILGKALFSSKTNRDLYSLQLYKHGVNGSRALYLHHWTSLSFPCCCHLKKHSQKWANPTG